MDRCIHEMELDQCAHCKLPPKGINKIVYATLGGQVFHNFPKCEYLASGQNWAESKGMNLHPINPVAWGTAMATRGACELCCIDYHNSLNRLK